MIRAENFNDLFKKTFDVIYVGGRWTNPRGLKCREIVGEQLVLTNPKNCLITLKERKLNYAYLIVEKFSYLSQVSKPEVLIAYNAKMSDYLNQKNGDFDGAYGLRIAKNEQLDYCYHTLKNDKDSRQAVITINDFTDRKPSKDVPCTLSFQFLIRDNKLDMIVNMRSNDLLWGTCLDIPAFCFIQEAMAFWLEVEIGQYIHQPASLHYYEEFEKKLLDTVNNEETLDKTIPSFDIDYLDYPFAFDEFWKQEENIRLKRGFVETRWECINIYLHQLYTYWINKDKKTTKSC